MSIAGGKVKTYNINFYLYKTLDYSQWYFSPSSMLSAQASIFHLNSPIGKRSGGFLNGAATNYTNGNVAPVINISPIYAARFIGNGTMSNPYQILQ